MNHEVLDLVYYENSTVNYKIITNPDGQRNVFIDPEKLSIGPFSEHFITIKTRLQNFSDLEILICAIKSLRGLGLNYFELHCPYFLGSTQDFKNILGQTRYFKDVLSPIINYLNFNSVHSFDTSHNLLDNHLNRFMNIPVEDFYNFALSEIYQEGFEGIDERAIFFVFNDYVFDNLNNLSLKLNFPVYEWEFVTKSFNKDDKKLNKVKLARDDYKGKDIIIINDFCMSGNKYLELAKQLNDKNIGKKYLIVTHGIFSNGFQKLDCEFEKIICTNSYSDLEGTFFIDEKKVQGVPIKSIQNLVSQFNVFNVNL